VFLSVPFCASAAADFNQLLADLTDIKAQLEPYSRAVQPVQVRVRYRVMQHGRG